MIVDERLSSFIRSMESDDEGIVSEIRREAILSGIPIVKPETAALLKVMILLRKPLRLLEVGTGTAYSAILMSEYMKEGSYIETIENYPPRIAAARENIKRAGREDMIKLIEGDAGEILPNLAGDTGSMGIYDMIFMDAAKGQYVHFLPSVLKLLGPGGLLVSDNVLQDGDIVSSRYAVTRRDRTIHSRMRDYLWQLKHSPQLETSVLSVGDGVALSVRL